MSQVKSKTQAGRRAKYGMNTGVAVAAAVALVVLINWIADRQSVRIDLTSMRQYHVSPQTLKVLESLRGDYQLITLFSREGAYVSQARDLIDAYGRQSTSLSVEHIDPARDIERLEAFYTLLRSRYQQRLEGIEKTIRDGRDVLLRIQKMASALLVPLRTMLEDEALIDQDLKVFTQAVVQSLVRFDSEIKIVDKQIDVTLQESLPAYSQAKRTLRHKLIELDQSVFKEAANRFARAVDRGRYPASITNNLLAVHELLGQARRDVYAAMASLDHAPQLEDYNHLVEQLQDREAVVLIGPTKVRLIDLGEIFREPKSNQVRSGQRLQLRFQCEEKITGAFIGLNLAHRPMVVFVNSGRLSVLGGHSRFGRVVGHLRNMNFEIRQWGPLPRKGSMGQQIAPGRPPEPQPGQKVVWVVLPIEASSSANSIDSGGRQRIADLLANRLAVGDGALVMLTTRLTHFGHPDPISDLLPRWGVSPKIDRLILRQIVRPNHEFGATSRLKVDQWPTELPITSALAGLPALFMQASPLALRLADPQEGLVVWPLVEVHGDDLWTQRDVTSDPHPKLDPATAGGSFVIAAAAQREEKRLIVVADPLWASNRITTAGRYGRPAEVTGVAYPANAEFFVNSVSWLAGLDQLIAASARTQDLRRVGPLTDAGLATLRWTLLLGLPLLVVLAGMGVWLVRRR